MTEENFGSELIDNSAFLADTFCPPEQIVKKENNLYEDVCSNCTASFNFSDDKIGEIYGVENGEIYPIAVADVIEIIFEHHPAELTSRNNILRCRNPREEFYLCLECSNRLSELYKTYKKFAQLCKLESLIWKKLGEVKSKSLNISQSRQKTSQDFCQSDEYLKNEYSSEGSDYCAAGSPLFETYNYNNNLEEIKKNLVEDSEEGRQLRPRKEMQTFAADLSDDSRSSDQKANYSSPSNSTGGDEFLINKRKRGKKQKIRKGRDGNAEKSQTMNSKRHKCSKCDKVYSRKELLTSHILSKHNGEPAFVCPKCNKKFVLRDSLENHMILHEEKSPFTCNLCQRKFTRADHLKNHTERNTCTLTRRQRWIMNEDPKSKAAMRRKMLKKYIKESGREEGPLPSRGKNSEIIYACDKCGREFKESFSFERHLLTHSEERSCVCDVCGKTFKHTAALNEHKVVHNDVRKFCCSACGRRFKRSNHLRAHEKLHAELVPRPFKCPEESCGKTFVEKKNWKQHLNIHYDRSAFVCSFCGRGFPNPSNLRSHERNIHFKGNSSTSVGATSMK